MSFYTAASSLNGRRGPLADRRVRQALNHAIEKAKLVRYDLLGNGRPLATMTMPGEIGHDPGLKPYPFDLAKAQRLLKEAGYPDGFRLSVLAKAQGMRAMKIIAVQLARVKVFLDVEETTDAAAVSDMKKKDWDWIFALCPDPMLILHPIHFLSSLSHSASGTRGMMNRWPGWPAPSTWRNSKIGMELDRYARRGPEPVHLPKGQDLRRHEGRASRALVTE